MIQKGEIRIKAKNCEVEQKYKIKQKGINVVLMELKQQLSAKGKRINRYEERLNQYRVNRTFDQVQRCVYQKIDMKLIKENQVPDANESKEFWRGIWDNLKEHIIATANG